MANWLDNFSLIKLKKIWGFDRIQFRMILSRTLSREATGDIRAKRRKNKVDQSNQKSNSFGRDFARSEGKLLEANDGALP